MAVDSAARMGRIGSGAVRTTVTEIPGISSAAGACRSIDEGNDLAGAYRVGAGGKACCRLCAYVNGIRLAYKVATRTGRERNSNGIGAGSAVHMGH